MSKIVLYTTPVCGYCFMAKNLLKSLGADYTEVNAWEQADEVDRLQAEHNWRSVPMIFINDKFMGGYDDIAALHRQGRLETILGM